MKNKLGIRRLPSGSELQDPTEEEILKITKRLAAPVGAAVGLSEGQEAAFEAREKAEERERIISKHLPSKQRIPNDRRLKNPHDQGSRSSRVERSNNRISGRF